MNFLCLFFVSVCLSYCLPVSHYISVCSSVRLFLSVCLYLSLSLCLYLFVCVFLSMLFLLVSFFSVVFKLGCGWLICQKNDPRLSSSRYLLWGTLERKKIAFFTNSYFEQILRFGKRCKTKVTGKPTNKKYSTLSSKGPRLLSKK
jgi:hypothetical protein